MFKSRTRFKKTKHAAFVDPDFHILHVYRKIAILKAAQTIRSLKTPHVFLVFCAAFNNVPMFYFKNVVRLLMLRIFNAKTEEQ